jgi:hypothetical protein
MHTRAGGYFRDKPTMKTTKSPTVHLRQTSVTDLPPELLSIIFKFVHDSAIPIQLEKDIIPTWMRMEGPKGFEQSVMALVHPTIPEDQRLKSPTLFPYSLAAVCSFWRDILCSYPEFWTLIVLFIDSKPTPLVDASLFLEWSREHNIDVFITRREGLRPPFYLDRHEKHHIDEFLHTLKPHLHRCRSLHIDAHLSSSLPIIYKTFNGQVKAPHFESMELICDADANDEGDGDSDVNLEDVFEPELRRLVIDGNNFCKHSELLDFWMSMDRSIPLEQLTIAHYQPGKNDGYNHKNLFNCFDDVDFFAVDQLKLESLPFPGCPFHIRPYFRSRFVHLEDLSAGFIADISKLAHFEGLSVLRITRCMLPSLQNFTNVPTTLILEEVSSNVNLLCVITDWEGENLWLDRCYSFPGSFLDALRRPSRRPNVGYPCNDMRRLLLYRLPNFSIVSLKRLIERRNDYVRYSHADWKMATDFGPAISHLAVVQCGKGKLSAKDEKWFRSRLVEFYWSSCFFFFTYRCR